MFPQLELLIVRAQVNAKVLQVSLALGTIPFLNCSLTLTYTECMGHIRPGRWSVGAEGRNR